MFLSFIFFPYAFTSLSPSFISRLPLIRFLSLLPPFPSLPPVHPNFLLFFHPFLFPSLPTLRFHLLPSFISSFLSSFPLYLLPFISLPSYSATIASFLLSPLFSSFRFLFFHRHLPLLFFYSVLRRFPTFASFSPSPISYLSFLYLLAFHFTVFHRLLPPFFIFYVNSFSSVSYFLYSIFIITFFLLVSVSPPFQS